MGKHWSNPHKRRGLWPRPTQPRDFPALFAADDLGLQRKRWFRGFLKKTGSCEEWQGGRLPWGYGQVNIGGRPFKAHRVAYAMYFGVDPGASNVCHRCDNPPCCRKSHLFLGSQGDNVQDMVQKGRQRSARGEQSGTARLTEKKVLEMRELFAAGMTDRAIAEQFGVGRMTAKYAIVGMTWAHLPNAQPPRGRHPFGEARSKLKEAEVLEIRRLHREQGYGYGRLAKRFKVDPTTIRSIVRRSSWTHL